MSLEKEKQKKKEEKLDWRDPEESRDRKKEPTPHSRAQSRKVNRIDTVPDVVTTSPT